MKIFLKIKIAIIVLATSLPSLSHAQYVDFVVDIKGIQGFAVEHAVQTAGLLLWKNMVKESRLLTDTILFKMNYIDSVRTVHMLSLMEVISIDNSQMEKTIKQTLKDANMVYQDLDSFVNSIGRYETERNSIRDIVVPHTKKVEKLVEMATKGGSTKNLLDAQARFAILEYALKESRALRHITMEVYNQIVFVDKFD